MEERRQVFSFRPDINDKSREMARKDKHNKKVIQYKRDKSIKKMKKPKKSFKRSKSALEAKPRGTNVYKYSDDTQNGFTMQNPDHDSYFRFGGKFVKKKKKKIKRKFLKENDQPIGYLKNTKSNALKKRERKIQVKDLNIPLSEIDEGRSEPSLQYSFTTLKIMKENEEKERLGSKQVNVNKLKRKLMREYLDYTQEKRQKMIELTYRREDKDKKKKLNPIESSNRMFRKAREHVRKKEQMKKDEEFLIKKKANRHKLRRMKKFVHLRDGICRVETINKSKSGRRKTTRDSSGRRLWMNKSATNIVNKLGYDIDDYPVRKSLTRRGNFR